MRGDIVKAIKSGKDKKGNMFRYFNLLEYGGEWLGSIRSWMQWNCSNGDQVDWGSNTYLNIKPQTVKDMEYTAARIAYSTLEEFKNHLMTDEDIQALKIYLNPKNWEGDKFVPKEGLYFTQEYLNLKPFEMNIRKKD